MSDHCQSIVDIDVAPQDAAAAAENLRNWLLRTGVIDKNTGDNVLSGAPGHFPGPTLSQCFDHETDETIADISRLAVCGVALTVGRAVFDTGSNGIELICDSCHARLANEPAYFDAVDAWAAGDDHVAYACPRCGHAQPVKHWNGPFVFGLGCMAAEFYNWPPLSTRFIESVAHALSHRVRLVRQYI